MGMFIELRVDRERCRDMSACGRCVEVCPVDVFALRDGRLVVDSENEDECTLCELCLQACPVGALLLVKLYEQPTDTRVSDPSWS